MLRIARYVIAGLFNSIAGLSFIYISMLNGLDVVESNIIGYSCGLILSFFLNKSWVFSYKNNWWPSFWRFLFVAAFGYIINLTIVLYLYKNGVASDVHAQFFGALGYAVTSYVGLRLFAFKDSKAKSR